MVAVATVLSMLTPVTPIMAKSTSKATSSGSTSGNQTNTIKPSVCKGTERLSGADAQIFSNITPDHEGTIVCSKSNGFQTKITGNNKVNSYHWTAWYKNKYRDEVDRTLGTGNYHGFSKEQVAAWSQNEDNIKKLNGGRFPEIKDYFYPTDTTTGKLSFWGDIAGYYSLLGDPQYEGIRLEAYQQFAYRVEKTTTSEEIGHDRNYCKENPKECAPPVKPSKPSGSNSSKPNSKPNINSGWGSNTNKKPLKPKPSEKEDGKDSIVSRPNKEDFKWDTGTTSYLQNTYCPGTTCLNNQHKPQGPQGLTQNTYPSISFGKTKSKGKSVKVPNKCKASNSSAACYDKQTSSRRYYLKDENGYATGYYKTVTTTVESHDEFKKVKVAEATVAANAYSTEIATYKRIALHPGSKGTLTYNVGHDKFWKVTPSYWVDGGKQVIKNNSSYPYHFASSGSEGNGKNNVNLYAVIAKRDKFYNLIHGYLSITDIDNIPDPNGFPKDEDNCVTVDNKEVCSKPETPLIDFDINIDDDEPQTQEEIDRFVHLTKDKK